MLHSCLSKRIVSMLRGLFRDASIQPFLSRCRNQFWYFNSRYLPLPSTNPIPVLFVFFQICMSPCETLKSFFMQSKMRRKWAVAPLGGPLWLNECKVFFFYRSHHGRCLIHLIRSVLSPVPIWWSGLVLGVVTAFRNPAQWLVILINRILSWQQLFCGIALRWAMYYFCVGRTCSFFPESSLCGHIEKS